MLLGEDAPSDSSRALALSCRVLLSRLHPDGPISRFGSALDVETSSTCCRYPQSGLDPVSKSSSRTNRSALYYRPAVRFLKRAVDVVKATTLLHQGPRPSSQSVADWARRSFTYSVAISPPPPSQTPTTAQHSPPQRQLSAGEGSSRPPATIYRISLTDGAGRVLLRRDVARGLRVEGVCYASAARPLWLLACAVAIRCCLK
jgi:hypothetical protein